MLISRLPYGGGGGSEIHGATIVVMTEESDLIGKQVDLYYGNIIFGSKFFNAEGIATFKGIQEIGTYYAECEGYKTNEVIISMEDIFNKNTVEILLSKAIELTEGGIYQFAGYEWMCVETIEGGYCLNSLGVTIDTYPVNTSQSHVSIDGLDISSKNTTLATLYDNIKSSEKINVKYGTGLFLVSKEKTGFVREQMSGSGYYWNALSEALKKYNSYPWTGTVLANALIYVVREKDYGGAYYNNQNLFAPAFNLDSSKAILDGNIILVRA